MVRLLHHTKKVEKAKEREMATKTAAKPKKDVTVTADSAYRSMQALRYLGLNPRYFDIEALTLDIATENPRTLEQVRIIAGRHFDGPVNERP